MTYKKYEKTAPAPLNQHDKHVARANDWRINKINWMEDTSQGYFTNGKPQYIVDPTTGKRYLNDTKMTVRFKCIFPGLIYIPILSAVAGIINILYRLIKFISGYHFWGNLEEEKTYEFCIETGDTRNKILQTFQARFDDISKMKRFHFENKCQNISIIEDENGVCNLTIHTLGDEEIRIKAIETERLINSQDSDEINHLVTYFRKVEETYNPKERFLNCIQDLARIPASCIVVIPLTLAALYGLYKPYEARKLISTIALAVCGTDEIAACFAPSPTHHALGGSLDTQGAL